MYLKNLDITARVKNKVSKVRKTYGQYILRREYTFFKLLRLYFLLWHSTQNSVSALPTYYFTGNMKTTIPICL